MEYVRKDIQELLVNERRIARWITITTWLIAIMVLVVGGAITYWIWLWGVLLLPLLIAVFVKAKAHKRIAGQTGLDTRVVRQLWRDSQKASKVASLYQALAGAAALVFFDAFFLNQGAYSGLFGLWVVLVSLPRSFTERFSLVRSQRLRNLGIYLVAVLMVFSLNWANNRIAQAQAEDLVAEIKTFHSKYGHYPASLNELVPEFIEHVPLAKYTLAFNRFIYRGGEDAMLMYVALPPFGRPYYNFADDRWGYLD
jgi:hypothetical protein